MIYRIENVAFTVHSLCSSINIERLKLDVSIDLKLLTFESAKVKKKSREYNKNEHEINLKTPH